MPNATARPRPCLGELHNQLDGGGGRAFITRTTRLRRARACCSFLNVGFKKSGKFHPCLKYQNSENCSRTRFARSGISIFLALLLRRETIILFAFSPGNAGGVKVLAVLLTLAPTAQGGRFDRNEIVNVKYHSRKENDISCLAN